MTSGPENEPSPQTTSASLHELRRTIRQQRRRRLWVMLRLACWPLVIVAICLLLLQLDTDRELAAKLLGVAVLLGFFGGMLVMAPGFRARLRRSRQLASQSRALRKESEVLEERLRDSATSREARGGVSLAEAADDKGTLSLVGQAGELSFESDASSPTSPTQAALGAMDRWQILLAAANARILILAAGLAAWMLVLLLIAWAEPDHVVIGGILFGVVFLVPALAVALPTMTAVSLLMADAQLGKAVCHRVSASALTILFETGDEATSLTTFPLSKRASLTEGDELPAVVALSDDRVLHAVDVPGVGWLARHAVRTE